MVKIAIRRVQGDGNLFRRSGKRTSDKAFAPAKAFCAYSSPPQEIAPLFLSVPRAENTEARLALKIKPLISQRLFVHVHSLRHIQQLLGHNATKTTTIYVQVANGTLMYIRDLLSWSYKGSTIIKPRYVPYEKMLTNEMLEIHIAPFFCNLL